jgi:hypothetical protein
MESFSVEYALLAMQRALELRVVTLDVNKEECMFYSQFYYDGEVSEQRLDYWDCAITEAGAALGPDCFEESQIKRLDYPEKIPPGGYCAYFRKEENSQHYAEHAFSKVKIKEKSIGYVLLAMQNALLGVVTPELRSVIVDFNQEELLLYVRFFYDGEIPMALIDLWNSTISKAKMDFGTNCVLDGKVERIDFPSVLPFRGRYSYKRKE